MLIRFQQNLQSTVIMKDNITTQFQTNLQLQNEELKSKYKKALQQLMHILKINKTLKSYMDQNNNSREESNRKEIQDLSQRHQEQFQSYAKQIETLNKEKIKYEQRKNTLEKELQSIKIERDKYKQEITLNYSKIKQWQRKQIAQQNNFTLNQIQIQREITQIKKENDRLKKNAIEYYGYQRERESYKQQLMDLRERLKEASLQSLQEKQKWRTEAFNLQTELLRFRSGEAQKLKNIELRCQFLESELNSYKNMEKYVEDEQKQMMNEQNIFENIREQMQKINRDYKNYETQTGNLLLKKQQQDMIRIKRISELEVQVQRCHQEIENYKNQVKRLQSSIKDLSKLQEKIQLLQSQKKELQEKNYVMEALNITQNHRNNIGIEEDIKEFQTKIRILLDENDKNIPAGAGGLQQIIMLKSYVRQLSDMLNFYKKKDERLVKKYESIKAKQKEVQSIYRHKFQSYKKKITQYDVFVNKLYSLLDQKAREKDLPNQEIQKEINLTLSHYEYKMNQMSDEILLLRNKKDELENQINNQLNLGLSEQEREQFHSTIHNLQIKVHQLQQKNSELASEIVMLGATTRKIPAFQSQLKEKDRIIEGLTLETERLNKSIIKNQEKEGDMQEKFSSHKKQIENLKKQIEEKVRVSDFLLMKSKASQPQLEKAAKLQEEVRMLQIQKASFKQMISQNQRNIATDKGQISSLTHQIEEYESQILQLNQQIQKYKSQIFQLRQRLANQQENLKKIQSQQQLISQLHNKVFSLQKQKNEAFRQLSNIQNQLKKGDNEISKDLQSLRRKNQALVEQINHKTSEAMINEDEQNRKMASIQLQNKQLQKNYDELKDTHISSIEKYEKQNEELQTVIFDIKTLNLTLRNELEDKINFIDQLKHQIYQNQLKIQRERSLPNTNGKDLPQSQNYEKLLFMFTLAGVQIEALRQRNEEIDRCYNQELSKHDETLRMLEKKQEELCNTLQKSFAENSAKKVNTSLIMHPEIGLQTPYIAQSLQQISSPTYSLNRYGPQVVVHPESQFKKTIKQSDISFHEEMPSSSFRLIQTRISDSQKPRDPVMLQQQQKDKDIILPQLQKSSSDQKRNYQISSGGIQVIKLNSMPTIRLESPSKGIVVRKIG